MPRAIEENVKNHDSVYLGGFIQQDPYAAAHEIIRQQKKHLTISKTASLPVVDQLIGAGCVDKLISTFTWNLMPTTAHCFVRAITQQIPHPLELEEYSILTLSLAYYAGALNLPYIASKTVMGSGFDGETNGNKARNRLKFETSPFTGERVCLIPPIKHDVGIIQVQRADIHGNAQAWGMMGESRYGMLSCDRIIVCAEEIVDTEVIMEDPNRTIIQDFRVNAVVEEPWGSHPSPLTGVHDLDWPYLAFYESQTRTQEAFEAYLQKWVLGVSSRKEYMELITSKRQKELRPEENLTAPTSHGLHTKHFEV